MRERRTRRSWVAEFIPPFEKMCKSILGPACPPLPENITLQTLGDGTSLVNTLGLWCILCCLIVTVMMPDEKFED